jgi:hypothetical protein
MAVSAQGSQFIWTDGTAAVTTAMDATGAVGQVNTINGPTGAAAIIDVTHLGSTAKEKLMGLPDEGQITLELNLDYSTTTNDKHKALVADRKARTKRAWGIILADGSSSLLKGDGYCTGFAVSGSVDAKLVASVTIEIDGPVTWTT